MRLSRFYNLNHTVKLINSGFFVLFLIFFLCYPSILYWLRIRLHNLFRFAFYEIIMVSWLGSRVWSIVSGWIRWFFVFFFKLHSSTLGWLGVKFHNLFWFVFYGVISVLWSMFDRLTKVDSTYFLISSFNIGLINNWVYCFLFIFSIGLSGSHDLGNKFDRLIRVDLNRCNMLSFQYFKNDVLFFLSQIIFLSVIWINLLNQPNHIKLICK
jgi:hypothetical protein